MKHRKIMAAALALPALLSPTTAFAHEGDHGTYVLTNIMHWLSSPTHSLFAVLGGIAFVGLAVSIIRKKRA